MSTIEERIKDLRNIGHNHRWIPCSEQFPDTSSYILLSFENFSLPAIGRYEEDEKGGAFYIGDDDESCVEQDLFVNAWMYLPAPYREGEEKDGTC